MKLSEILLARARKRNGGDVLPIVGLVILEYLDELEARGVIPRPREVGPGEKASLEEEIARQLFPNVEDPETPDARIPDGGVLPVTRANLYSTIAESLKQNNSRLSVEVKLKSSFDDSIRRFGFDA